MRVLTVKIFIVMLFFPLTSIAQNLCQPTGWNAPYYGFQERAFILGGKDSFNDLSRYSRYSGSEKEIELSDILVTLGFTELLKNTPRVCDSPYQGQIIINRVRQLGPHHSYIRFLATNQILALSNCNWNQNEKTVLPKSNWSEVEDMNDEVLKFAQQDFAYLEGVAYFLDRKLDQALGAFRLIANDDKSPHRSAARLMQVRVLRKLNADEKAYSLAKKYRISANDDFRLALDKQEDIIAQYGSSKKLSVLHLEKVYRRLVRLPIENEQLGYRVGQGSRDFDGYFMNEIARLSHKDRSQLSHDWWLHPDEPQGDNLAFHAVHNLSSKYDDIDWVQAYHSSVAFNRHNTWFSGPDIPIDDAYNRVTKHAYNKWQKGSARWAMIVAKRIEPGSIYLSELKATAKSMGEKASYCGLNPTDYVIYARVIHHIVRLAAMNGDYEDALTFLGYMNRNKLYPDFDGVMGTSDALERLLFVRNQYAFFEKLKNKRNEWTANSRYGRRSIRQVNQPARIWTAKSANDLLMQNNHNELMSLVNLMSSESIEKLFFKKTSQSKLFVRSEIFTKMAEVLWVRGFLFADESQMSKAKPYLIQAHRQLKQHFRQIEHAKTVQSRDFARAMMVLRNPGLSPYIDNLSKRKNEKISEYNSLNPIEGNWWCNASDRATVLNNEARIKDKFLFSFFKDRTALRLSSHRLSRGDLIIKSYKERDNNILNTVWNRFRNEYGPFELISMEEQKKLAEIPRASEWLAAKVKAYVDSPVGLVDRFLSRDERIPESLHRIVETTRFSCHTLEKGNAETSKWAFEKLHRYYGDTTWAAKTPYWYNSVQR